MAEGMASNWTAGTYAIHNEAMRVSETLHNKEMREVEIKLQEEKIRHLEEVVDLNDRRYSEGNELRDKALKIKETADRDALVLDRASQAYKEERNDAMREQSLKNNGFYATREDLAEVVKGIARELQPLVDYVSAQKGVVQGAETNIKKIYAAITAVCIIVPTVVILANIFIK